MNFSGLFFRATISDKICLRAHLNNKPLNMMKYVKLFSCVGGDIGEIGISCILE